MTFDPTGFHRLNVVDTCAVWNVLSSKTLHQAAGSAGCVFSCTRFVYYECLVKPRKIISNEDLELQRRLKQERKRGQFQDYHLEMDDLLEVELLERRRNLGKGELSSIAFARRTRQAFLTDDQKARRLAEQVMETRMVQTTPYLLGWLFYIGILMDHDMDRIIEEHESLEKRIPLTGFFEAIYMRSLEYKLLARGLDA